MPHFSTDEPKTVNLKEYVGKPVILEPIQEMQNPDPKWNSVPWEAVVWVDEGNGYEATNLLIFAKAITDVFMKTKDISEVWLGGILVSKGSQLWLDSSNAMIMKMLETEWEKIAGSDK
jgi:hypothetical protein